MKKRWPKLKVGDLLWNRDRHVFGIVTKIQDNEISYLYFDLTGTVRPGSKINGTYKDLRVLRVTKDERRMLELMHPELCRPIEPPKEE